MGDSKTSSGGVGFFGLLTIAFVVLKLCNVINWSWWWVTCPFWGMWAIYLVWSIFYVIYKNRKIKDKQNMITAGYNEVGWEKGGKSRWQQRMEEMQKKQKSDAN